MYSKLITFKELIHERLRRYDNEALRSYLSVKTTIENLVGVNYATLRSKEDLELKIDDVITQTGCDREELIYVMTSIEFLFKTIFTDEEIQQLLGRFSSSVFKNELANGLIRKTKDAVPRSVPDESLIFVLPYYLLGVTHVSKGK